MVANLEVMECVEQPTVTRAIIAALRGIISANGSFLIQKSQSLKTNDHIIL